MTPLPASPTGAELVAAVRAEAERRGVTANALVRRLTVHPQTWLAQTALARHPKPTTVARVAALIAGDPVPPKRIYNRQPSADLRHAVATEARAQGTRRADARSIQTVSRAARLASHDRGPQPTLPAGFVPIDREPCFACGTRGDLGCAHRPLELR